MEEDFKFNLGDILIHAAEKEYSSKHYKVVARGKMAHIEGFVENIYLVAFDGGRGFVSECELKIV